MPTYGLTTTGFVPKTYEILVEEVRASLRVAFGPSINLTNGIMAKFVMIVCEQYAEVWESLEAVYSSQDPDQALDAALEALCALSGTIRNGAAPSKVVLTLTGTPATLVTTGSRAATFSTSKKFATLANATITLVNTWAAVTAYSLNDRVTKSSKVYQCTTAGTSGTSGPAGNTIDIADGTAVWAYLGEGTGAIDVSAACTVTGPITGYSRDITVIDTPVGGWQSVINVLDAAQGANTETNEQLRARRELELAQSGSSTVDALRATLLEVATVTAVTVFMNKEDATDADGIPPHAVECLIRGGIDQNLFNALLANVAAGIKTYGTTTGAAVDSQGTSHVMKFSRPAELGIYLTIGVIYDARYYPTNGDTAIKDSLVAWGALQATGKNATYSGISARISTIPGVLEVTYLGISLTSIATVAPWVALTAYVAGNVVLNAGRIYRCTTNGTSAASGGPSAAVAGITDGTAVWEYLGASIAVALRQLATYDTSRITVVSLAGTP